LYFIRSMKYPFVRASSIAGNRSDVAYGDVCCRFGSGHGGGQGVTLSTHRPLVLRHDASPAHRRCVPRIPLGLATSGCPCMPHSMGEPHNSLGEDNRAPSATLPDGPVSTACVHKNAFCQRQASGCADAARACRPVSSCTDRSHRGAIVAIHHPPSCVE